jgi:Ribbon-helix-helix protein, copG family
MATMRLADHAETPMKRTVLVDLSTFSVEALRGGDGADPEVVPAHLLRAIRLYLSVDDRDSPGWSVPASLRDEDAGGVRLQLSADESLIAALEQEADRQGVSLSQLARQAVLYYAAELDAGRITQRLAEALDGEAS